MFLQQRNYINFLFYITSTLSSLNLFVFYVYIFTEFQLKTSSWHFFISKMMDLLDTVCIRRMFMIIMISIILIIYPFLVPIRGLNFSSHDRKKKRAVYRKNDCKKKSKSSRNMFLGFFLIFQNF